MPNWDAILREINKTAGTDGQSPVDVVRRSYIRKLHDHTGRNVICYYSGFLSKPKIEGVEITDEDKNGLMLCSHKIERDKGLDLILHTPGGDVAATESLIHYLKEMFGDNVRAIIPQIAMSAGTMIACSCKEIVLGKHSNIGPVDPQFNGIPAIGVLQEVERAFNQIKEDQRAVLLWSPMLSRLPPSFLQQCQWAIAKSEELIEKVLRDGMFKDAEEPLRSETVTRIVKRLTDLSYNKTHNRHIHYQECIELGLKIKMLEDPADRVFQDLVLTVHHCLMHTLQNTAAYKIVENHLGRAVVKISPQQAPFLLQLPVNPGISPAPSRPT